MLKGSRVSLIKAKLPDDNHVLSLGCDHCFIYQSSASLVQAHKKERHQMYKDTHIFDVTPVSKMACYTTFTGASEIHPHFSIVS